MAVTPVRNLIFHWKPAKGLKMVVQAVVWPPVSKNFRENTGKNRKGDGKLPLIHSFSPVIRMFSVFLRRSGTGKLDPWYQGMSWEYQGKPTAKFGRDSPGAVAVGPLLK
jgi:hypothetical protein